VGAVFADRVHLVSALAASSRAPVALLSQSMHVFLFVALAVALVGVVVVLGLGFYALFRGGEFGRRWSNKLMQVRVLIQAAAIAILASIVWLSQAGHGH
jgi:hypothetical protein